MEHLIKRLEGNIVEKIDFGSTNKQSIFAWLKFGEKIEIPTNLVSEIIAEIDTNYVTTYCNDKGRCVNFFKEQHFEQLKILASSI